MATSLARSSVPVPVLARADVTLGVERLAAERARRPAGGDDPGGALGESLGSSGIEPYPQHVGPVVARR